MEYKVFVKNEENVKKELDKKEFKYINEDEISDVSEKLETNENDPFEYLTDEFEEFNSVPGTQKTLDQMVLRRSARLSRSETQPVTERTLFSSKTEKLLKSIQKCYVLLTREDNDKDKDQDLATVQLRRSPRNIRRLYYKDPSPERKSPKKINRGSKAKTSPAKRVTRSACGKNGNNAITEDDKNLKSPMDRAAKNMAKIKELQMRSLRSTVQKPMLVEDREEQVDKYEDNTVQTSEHVSRNKPQTQRALKKWFTDEEENITTRAETCSLSMRDAHTLPEPCKRVTRSMSRLAEERKSARLRRRCTVCY